MTFSTSEVGLFVLAAFVFGVTCGFGWSDRRWTRHNRDAAEVSRG